MILKKKCTIFLNYWFKMQKRKENSNILWWHFVIMGHTHVRNTYIICIYETKIYGAIFIKACPKCRSAKPRFTLGKRHSPAWRYSYLREIRWPACIRIVKLLSTEYRYKFATTRLFLSCICYCRKSNSKFALKADKLVVASEWDIFQI